MHINLPLLCISKTPTNSLKVWPPCISCSMYGSQLVCVTRRKLNACYVPTFSLAPAVASQIQPSTTINLYHFRIHMHVDMPLVCCSKIPKNMPDVWPATHHPPHFIQFISRFLRLKPLKEAHFYLRDWHRLVCCPETPMNMLDVWPALPLLQ
jgi:hypothetical protein